MKSIFSRLILSFFVIILIAIFSISIFFSRLLKDNLIRQKEIELKNKGNQIVEITGKFLNNEMDENTFSFVLNSIDEIVGSRTLILNKSGTVIKPPPRYPRYTPPRPPRAETFDDKDISQILDGLTVVKTGYSIFFNEPMIIVGMPIHIDNNMSNILGAVILSSPVTGVTTAINRTYAMLAFASIGALIFSLLGAYFLSKTLSKPIHMISGAALEIAEGNYSKKVDIKRQDEIGILASSFNYLTEKLNATIGDLNNEKTKLSDILFCMEEGLIAVDNNLKVIHSNPAALSLLRSEDVFDNTLLNTTDEGNIEPSVREVLTSGKSKSFERCISDNRFVNILVSPLRYQNDEIYGAIILLQDISESVKLEKMRRDFVANVSHELRTPLTSIRGFIEPLIDGTVDDDKTRLKYSEIIRNETLRLERLINDLLDLSRLQAGKITLDIQRVDITELISNVSAKFQHIFDSKGIEFSFKRPDAPVFISADGDKIEQLIIIFIDNAIKYTLPGGKIEIILTIDGKLAKISVKDSGIGISEDDLPYIWDRFYKADKSRTDKTSGTGLGLSIAKNIIELHGQKVSVQSKVREGSVFQFTMNISDSD